MVTYTKDPAYSVQKESYLKTIFVQGDAEQIKYIWAESAYAWKTILEMGTNVWNQ